MIPLKRLPEPAVLTQCKTEWLRKFLEKRKATPGARPSHKQYAHEEIVHRLEAMSFHKCFYCEQSTQQTRKEVDHHIEIAEQPERAFDWDNLYLVCFECNHHKQPNKSVPASECIDPCDASCAPADHLAFDDEFIRARDDSPRGRQTIRKYNLNRDDLNYKRARILRKFDAELIRIQKTMLAESRKEMTSAEKENLRAFRQREQPFSLMMQGYLAAANL